MFYKFSGKAILCSFLKLFVIQLNDLLENLTNTLILSKEVDWGKREFHIY